MDCKFIKEKLIGYVFGDLSSEENQQIKTHIESCKSCKKELENVQATLGAVKDAQKEPSPFFWKDFQEGIKKKMEGQTQVVIRPARRKIALVPRLVWISAFILIIAITAGLYLQTKTEISIGPIVEKQVDEETIILAYNNRSDLEIIDEIFFEEESRLLGM